MRPVRLVVGASSNGSAITWAYPDGGAQRYKIPTYELKAAGKDGAGIASEKTFEVFRFGVQQVGKTGTPRVVGLAEHQKHTIKAWLPHYSVHSATSLEKGAWQVYGNFLIHDGPDDPHRQVYASIGCIELCGGPAGFDIFNDYLIALSGPTASGRDKQLLQIGNAKNITIEYIKASRPPLVLVP